MSKERIKVLDGLRGLAVLLVFLSHTSGRDQTVAPFLNFLGLGHIGVYLFFTLSAFLLGLGLFSKKFDKRALKAFFIKRFLRIAPLYYLIVSAVFYYQTYSHTVTEKYLHIKNGISGYWEHIFFYRGDGVFWSIVSEMQFYLMVPIFVWIILRFKSKGIIVLSILAILNFIFYLAKYAGISDFILFLSPNTLERGTFIDIFLPGVFIAYFVISKPHVIERYKTTLHKLANFLLIVGGFVTLALVAKNFLGFNRIFYEFRFFSILFGLSFGVITLSLYQGGNRLLQNIFSNSFLRFIGRIGFSFYLLHMAVFQFINSFILPEPVKFITSFVVVTSISTITFYFIEKPSISFSYYLIKKLGLSKPKASV